MKVWFIQNVVAPYRIPLFRALSETPEVQFEVILLAQRMKNLPQWEVPLEDFPFEARRIPGFCLNFGYERILCLNPILLYQMARQRPDVVVCSGYSLATVMIMIYRLLGLGRYVIWMEGTRYTEGRRSGWRARLRRVLMKYASAYIDAGEMSREYMKSLLPAQNEKPFFTSFNCIETERFARDSVNNGQVSEIKKQFTRKNLLYVGQLVERKGIRQLLKVFHGLHNEFGDEIGLIMVGNGPLVDYVEEYKRTNSINTIYMPGYVDYQDIPAYYRMSDVFVILSIDDPNPLVLFEALTTGTPIVCSERAGNSVDFIANGKNGYIVDPENIMSVTKQITDILTWDMSKRSAAAAVSAKLVKKANYRNSAKAFINACRAAVVSND